VHGGNAQGERFPDHLDYPSIPWSRVFRGDKVVILDAPGGSNSSSVEENLVFRIDEAAKVIAFADGVPLSVQRFDDRWISATHGDTSYEFDRQNDNVAHAGTSIKDGIATIIIGSGRCKTAGPAG
jgi:hypothetical protein